MRTLEAATEAVIDGGRFIRRDAILFDLAEGQYGFWWGEGEFQWNGLTFVGAGSLLKLDPVAFNSDGAPTEITVTLRAMPTAGLTPDVLASIEDYTYHLRQALLYRFYFDPDTKVMTGTAPTVLFRGSIDQIDQDDQPDGQFALIARLVSKSADYRRTGHRKRGNEHQKLLNGGTTDLFYEHAAEAGTITLKWGQG